MFFMSYIVLVSSPKGREELVPQTGSSPQPELGERLGCCDEILKKNYEFRSTSFQTSPHSEEAFINVR